MPTEPGGKEPATPPDPAVTPPRPATSATPPGATPPGGVDLARTALAQARADARARANGDPGYTDPPRRGAARSTTSGSRRLSARRLADLRSGPGPDERDPQPLAGAFDRLVRDRGWQTEAAVGSLTGRWAEIVGPEIAEHVQIESYDPEAARLHLRADSTAWATQLRLLLPTLRTRIDAEVGTTRAGGGRAVADIVILGPAAPVRPAGAWRVKGRGPRDTYG